MRTALLDLPNVEKAGVDIDAGLAYVLPNGEFDEDQAISALKEAGDYTGSIK